MYTETKNEWRYMNGNEKCLFCELDNDIITENEQGKNINPSRHEILKDQNSEKHQEITLSWA